MSKHLGALACALIGLSMGAFAQAMPTAAQHAATGRPILLASTIKASDGEMLRREVGRLREEVGRLSLDAMIDAILQEQSGPAEVRPN